MNKILIAALLMPAMASATQQNLPPEASAALQFNQWYISQIMGGKEPITHYLVLRRYVTRDTISKLKMMNQRDPNEYDVPDVDMFIKAQGYQADWKSVRVEAMDYDAACVQVYVTFGVKQPHTVVDCMVKEEGNWKVQSVAGLAFSQNITQ